MLAAEQVVTVYHVRVLVVVNLFKLELFVRLLIFDAFKLSTFHVYCSANGGGCFKHFVFVLRVLLI